jgi:esterase/lipase
MMAKVFFRNPEGLKLCGILHSPKNKSDVGIIICHGFTGGKDKNFIPELAEKLEDFFVLRFDFSGNWESEGEFEDRSYLKYIDDLGSAIDFLKKYCKKICVVGTSMGGSIALLHSVQKNNIDLLVMIAPGLGKFKEEYPKKLRSLDKKDFIIFTDSWGKERKLNREYFKERSKYKFIEEGKKLRIPTLIIVGDNDKVISVPKCEELYDCLNVEKKLVIVKNENHVFHNKVCSEMIKSISNFIKNRFR